MNVVIGELWGPILDWKIDTCINYLYIYATILLYLSVLCFVSSFVSRIDSMQKYIKGLTLDGKIDTWVNTKIFRWIYILASSEILLECCNTLHQCFCRPQFLYFWMTFYKIAYAKFDVTFLQNPPFWCEGARYCKLFWLSLLGIRWISEWN